jgi:GABA permease
VLAARRDAPQMLVKVNARKVPVYSVLIGSLAGFLGIIAATEAPQQVFDFLVSASGALIVYVYMAIVVAQMKLRNRRQREGGPKPAIEMWLYPWLSLLALGGMAAVLIAMAVTPALQQDFKASCVTLVIAVVAYAILYQRRRAKAS